MKLITRLRLFEDSITRGTLKDEDRPEYYCLKNILNSYEQGFFVTLDRESLEYLLKQLNWDTYGMKTEYLKRKQNKAKVL